MVFADKRRGSSGVSVGSALPVVGFSSGVLFPGMMTPLEVGDAVSVAGFDAVAGGGRSVVLLGLREVGGEFVDPGDVFDVGVVCQVLRAKKRQDGWMVLLKGVERVRVSRFLRAGDGGGLLAEVVSFPLVGVSAADEAVLLGDLRERFEELVAGGVLSLGEDSLAFMRSLSNAGEFADYVAFNVSSLAGSKQAVLEAVDVVEKVSLVLGMLEVEAHAAETRRVVQRRVKDSMDATQRDFILREQIKVLQGQLSSGSDDDELGVLRRSLDEAGLSPVALAEANREFGRLSRMNRDSPEANVIRSYLGTLVDLPWGRVTVDRSDLVAAREVLDRDHFGLRDVKDRVIEFLAVRKLRAERLAAGDLGVGERGRGSVLLFSGPPGVGKTSVAKSIAEALGREYVRISLGGVRDESDIRGHRRSYIGSMPGRLIQALRQVKSRNPVILLDEVDKLGESFHGDPAAALLEVLDPSQNDGFVDHYLGVPFDLSEVMFVATANSLDGISEPLLDRLEVVEFGSYVAEERKVIASRFLVPRLVRECGLLPHQFGVSDGALDALVLSYTREAGVRSLDRALGKLVRKVATEVACGVSDAVLVGVDDLESYLGARRFVGESELESDLVGVATGMYFTPAGGDILFVETTLTDGDGGLSLTGRLGDVMRESAQAAWTLVRSHSESLGIPRDVFGSVTAHVHVPDAATPKDGPSAGVVLGLALVSALSGVPTRRDVALTGEVTLRGRVLPVGGLREKFLGAKRAGIKHVVFPVGNEADVRDIDPGLLSGLTLHPVASFEQVLDLGLVGGFGALLEASAASADVVGVDGVDDVGDDSEVVSLVGLGGSSLVRVR
jgi:ATP-dependent Lon protease